MLNHAAVNYAPQTAARLVQSRKVVNVVPLKNGALNDAPWLPLPVTNKAAGLERFPLLTAMRRRLVRGQALFHAGDVFESVYSVRSGFLKTIVTLSDGRQQITGFHMTGDLVGMDGIDVGVHGCQVIAVEDSEVYILPFRRLEELARIEPEVQHYVHRMLSSEIIRDHDLMMLLGLMRADERVSAFLLNLSRRYATRGYSAAEFHLRMTREDIGNFLGLKLETVSRTLSRMQEEGLLKVSLKHICLLDLDALRRFADADRRAKPMNLPPPTRRYAA